MQDTIEGVYLVAKYVEELDKDALVTIKDKVTGKVIVIDDKHLGLQSQAFFIQFHAAIMSNKHEEMIELLDYWKVFYEIE